MASGKTHSKAGLVTIAGTIFASPFVAQIISPEAAIGVIGGAVLGWLISPDLDLPQRTYDEHRMLDLNPVIGLLWVGFWASYGQIFTHRGISHWPILGTLTRIVWAVRHLIFLFVCLMALQWAGIIQFVKDIYVPLIGFDILLSVMVGWMIQDFTHLALDGILLGTRRVKPTVVGNKRVNPHKYLTFIFFVVIILLLIHRMTNGH